MTVRSIMIAGDPVLHTPARTVDTIDTDIHTLVSDMFETMEAAPGVGLAAPQIGIPLRIFVYSYTDDAGTSWRGVAINPSLWISPPPTHDASDDEAEGCLSFPAERFPLVRSNTALLHATNLEGQKYEIAAEGWLARIFQHEYDHLNGILYVDRLMPPHKQAARKKLTKSHGVDIPGQSWNPLDDLIEP